MKIGFFGGSFNPPTFAHISIAKTSIEKFGLDKVFFVPMGNSYNKPDLIDEKFRYEMLELLKDEKIYVEDIELNRDCGFSTLEAFRLIEEKYKNKDTHIFYIMGADNFEKLPNWNDSKQLIENFEYLIFERNNSHTINNIEKIPLLNENKNNFHFFRLENYSEVSSGVIRKLIKEHNFEECKKYTKPEIIEYIKTNKLYQ